MAANAVHAALGLFARFVAARLAGLAFIGLLRPAAALILFFAIGNFVRLRVLLNLRFTLMRVLGRLLQLRVARHLTGGLLRGVLPAQIGLLRDDLL